MDLSLLCSIVSTTSGKDEWGDTMCSIVSTTSVKDEWGDTISYLEVFCSNLLVPLGVWPPGAGSPPTCLIILTWDVVICCCCNCNLSHIAHACATSLMNIVSSLFDHPPCQTLAGPHTSTTQLLLQLFCFSPLPIEVVAVVVVMLVGGPTSSGASKLASSCGFASRDREKKAWKWVCWFTQRWRESVYVRERDWERECLVLYVWQSLTKRKCTKVLLFLEPIL